MGFVRLPFRPAFRIFSAGLNKTRDWMANNSINFLSGNPLNRVSWLRSSPRVLNSTAHSPHTRWLLFNAGDPLVRTSTGQLARLSASVLRPIFGWRAGADEDDRDEGPGEGGIDESKMFGQVYVPPNERKGRHGGEFADMMTARFTSAPIVVFLGVLESSSTSLDQPSVQVSEGVKGVPYFALDVAGTGKEQDILGLKIEGVDEEVGWGSARLASAGFTSEDSAIFGEARSMLDWNARNKFCPGCGSRTFSIWGGWKLVCRSFLPGAERLPEPCPTGTGLHNFMHPRTDPVVITAILDETGDRILLGRNKKFPGNFYSTLAGFIEPAETFEEAVAREIYEESGIHVTNITYQSCQPWPYPANLMIGFYARANSSEPIRIDLDGELADARWFTREEVIAVLAHPDGTNLRRRDYAKLDEITSGSAPKQQQQQPAGIESASDPDASQAAAGSKTGVHKERTDVGGPPFKVPPRNAIAGVLISDWAYRRSKL